MIFNSDETFDNIIMKKLVSQLLIIMCCVSKHAFFHVPVCE